MSVRREQFVGACNPPGDAGRTPLPPRFLARAPVLLVDFPRPDSLRTIYGAINAALLKTQPSLKPLATPLTDAMIDGMGINMLSNRFTISGFPQWFPFGVPGVNYQQQDETMQFRFAIEERG